MSWDEIEFDGKWPALAELTGRFYMLSAYASRAAAYELVGPLLFFPFGFQDEE